MRDTMNLRRALQVGDCLFRVPRRPFEEKSTVFGDMFSLPQDPRRKQDDYNVCSDEEPLYLAGIDKQDFRSFLKVLLGSERFATSMIFNYDCSL